MGLADGSVIFYKLRESSEKNSETGFEHDLGHIKPLTNKLFSETLSGFSIYNLNRIGKKVGSESMQKSRLLKATFASAEERDLLLENSRKLIGFKIYVCEGLDLVDRIAKQSVEVEINERQRNGETNLTHEGFHVVKVWSKMAPKPLSVLSESSQSKRCIIPILIVYIIKWSNPKQ